MFSINHTKRIKIFISTLFVFSMFFSPVLSVGVVLADEIDVGEHPNTDAQLPEDLSNNTGITSEQIQQESPQNDFVFSDDLVGYTDPNDPGKAIIWAPPVSPTNETEDSEEEKKEQNSEVVEQTTTEIKSVSAPSAPLPPPPVALTSTSNSSNSSLITSQNFNHTCALPDSLGDTKVEPVIMGWDGISLQDVFNQKGINRNVITDQKQYQLWSTPSATTTINIEFISRNAGLNSVFGYYKNGDISTFVPIFRSGPSATYSTTPEFSYGQSVSLDIVGANNIGFAIKTSDSKTYTTLNSLNENGNDHAVVYELGDNTFSINFEDLAIASSDNDFNDIMVKMTTTGCQNPPVNPPTNPQIPSCQLNPQNGRTIVNFSEKLFVGSLLQTQSKSVNLVPGNYKVTLQSYDGYNGRQNVSQPHEEWFVKFFDNQSNLIGQSATSTDLADNVLEDSRIDVVNQSLTLNSTTTSVVGWHGPSSVYGDMSNPNSLYPICASFDLLMLPIPPTINTPPTITLIGNNPLSITVGNIFTDPGATATDTEDGNLTSQIVRTGTVNASTTGSYTLTYTVTDSGGLSASTTRVINVVPVVVPPPPPPPINPPTIDLSCKIISPNQTGWYGTYFNYRSTTTGMELPNTNWNLSYGDPLSSSASSSQWYTNQFARFSRIDNSLSFGDNFFPFDSNPEEIINGHDYHFGVRWSAKVMATTTGTYGFTLTSDDDAWVYVNGQLVVNNEGVHSAKTITATTTLSAGSNLVDIFFTERHTTKSMMSFSFNDQNLLIKPHSPVCPPINTPPTITLIGNNPLSITIGNIFTDPGATATDTEDGNLTSQIVRTGTVNASTTGSYTLTYVVKDSGNLYATTTRQVIVVPISTPVSPTVSLSANPSVITVGDSSNLSWSSNNTNSCSAVWTNATSTSGTFNVSPSVTTEYVITCTGSNGSATATTTVTVNSVPPVNPPGGGGGGGGIGGRRHPIVVGEILGATTCSYLRDYLKIDWQNDNIEVLKLQSFLNQFENENLLYTGVFNQATFEAVQRFQTKYSGDILEPWGDKVTTGFVYILTKKKINEIYCNTIYPLSQTDRNEIDTFRVSTGGNSNKSILGQDGIVYGAQDVIVISDNVLDESPVIELKDNETEKSVARNLAISLFALPQKIFANLFNSCGYNFILLLLILIALIIIIFKLFTNSKKSFSDNLTSASITEIPVAKEESPVIILPGVTKEKDEEVEILKILPDEEIVIENPEEAPDETPISVPDLRDGEDKKIS